MENNVWVPDFSVGPQLKFYLPCSINIFVLTCDVASLILISERKMIGQIPFTFPSFTSCEKYHNTSQIQSLWFFFFWENRRGDMWRLRVRRMTWNLNWGCVVREKAGIWSVTNFSLTANPKGLMGMELKFVRDVMCHTVSTTVLGYKPKIPRESAFEKSLITFMPLLFTVIYFKKF